MSDQDSSDSQEFDSPETLSLSVISSSDDLESISVPPRTRSREPVDHWLRAWNSAGSHHPTISLLPASYRAALEAEDRRFRDLMAHVGSDPGAHEPPETGQRSGHSSDVGRQSGSPTIAHESLYFSEEDFVHMPVPRTHPAYGSTSTDSSTTNETHSHADGSPHHAPSSLRRSHSRDMLAARGLAWRLRTWRGSGGLRGHPHLPASTLAMPEHPHQHPRHTRVTIVTTDHDETDRNIAADRGSSLVRRLSDDSSSDSGSDSPRSLSPPRDVYHYGRR